MNEMIKRNVSVSLVVCVSVICFFAAGPEAQVFSLWGEEEMTTCSTYADPFVEFSMYLTLYPGTEGASGVVYKLLGPTGHVLQDAIPAAFVSLPVTGVLYGSPGGSMTFNTCQTESVWICRYVLISMNEDPDYYSLQAHDDTRQIGIRTCEAGTPYATAQVYNNFCFHDDWCRCRTAVDECSWSAIKTLCSVNTRDAGMPCGSSSP
jgi:hypothetical protein